jgi:MoaA/NifB/PqqE/SkfB family radical SAM enzyme
MTGTAGLKPGAVPAAPVIDSVRLTKGAVVAKHLGATTALITGKGEPTLWPERLLEAVAVVGGTMPLVEVQTNGIALTDELLDGLYARGVTMVALSCVHYKLSANRECYGKGYKALRATINRIHEAGISVRLTVMLCKGWIDSVDEVERLIRFAHENQVEQLTIRSVAVPTGASWRNPEVRKWTDEHRMDLPVMVEIKEHIEARSVRLNTLVHGHVYAYNLGKGEEQNVCMSDCLTRDPDSNEIRQLIYCPDGHIRYDWEHDAAIVF